MCLGLLSAWTLQDWAGGGRARALAELDLSHDANAIERQLEKEELEKLPSWIDRKVVKDVWENLLTRLHKDADLARLWRDATQLQAVHSDINARVEYLVDGLHLVEEFDLMLSKLDANKQKNVKDHVTEHLPLLCRKIKHQKKAELQDPKTGAPGTLDLMHTYLKELKPKPDEEASRGRDKEDSSGEARRELAKRAGQIGRRIRRLILAMDYLSMAVAFAVALAAGLASRVAGQATFGTMEDYLSAALWGFGVATITNASLGEVRKKLYPA
jgi:hypothetical protein